MDPNEEVLCIRTDLLPWLDGATETFTNQVNKATLWSKLSVGYEFIRRGDCEEDPSWQQLIPYVVVKNETNMFGYRRLEAGGEQRLHGKISCGVGGHINRGDMEASPDVLDILEHAALRELQEELNLLEFPFQREEEIETGWLKRRLNPKFVLKDTRDEAGRVHLGVVYVLDATALQVTVRETDAHEGFYFKPDEPHPELNWEGWSEIVLQEHRVGTLN